MSACRKHQARANNDDHTPWTDVMTTIHLHPKNATARVLGRRLANGDTVTRDTLYPAADGVWRPVARDMAGMTLTHDNHLFVRPAPTVTIEAPSREELAALSATTGLESLLAKLHAGVPS